MYGGHGRDHGGHGCDHGGGGVRGSNRILAVQGTQTRTAASSKRT